ncbi:MAG TPA: adenylate kinase family protein [Thermoplasmata archaeon]|nr:adenylate kinase family protein [Thermoplasmata archaeon]
MRVALTGTPGTGKTSVAEILARRGYYVVHVSRLAEERGLIVGFDAMRNAREVDVGSLDRAVQVPAKLGFLVGHYAHLLSVTLAVVLRCHPQTLAKRLRNRGWPDAKIRENVEAEAIDVITQEAVARLPFVYEIDTTDLLPEQTAMMVVQILQGRLAGHEAGSVDWSDEVLSWY